MLRIKIKILFVQLLLIFCFSRGFIYDVRVMRQWDRINSFYRYFVGFGDFHDKNHKVTPLQIKQIDNIISRCRSDSTKLVFEDIASVGSSGTKHCGRFFVNPNGGILGGLACKYRKKGFSFVDNVEYRFCRVTSLAPVIKNINFDFRRVFPTSNVSVGRLRNEIESTAREILNYKDGNIANNWYKKCVSLAANNMRILKFDKMSKMSVANYIYSNTSPKNRLDFVKKLLIFDSSLIDAKIVHSIVSLPRTRNSVVIAGGSHIRNVSLILQRLGYESIYRSKILIRKEYDSKKCLGSNILPGGFCCKPVPADLRVLNRFF